MKKNQDRKYLSETLPNYKPMGRGKKPTAKKDTRTEIVNGAIDLFSQKGYTETSMREIALEADIQPGSIYNHFRSKQEILEYILATYAAFVEEHMFLPQTVEDLKNGVTIDKIMDCMLFAFPESEQYRKMLYIILHEQHRNEIVRKFMIDIFILKNELYVKNIIDMLLEQNLIEPADSNAVAKLHVATIYYWSNVNLLGLDTSESYVAGGSMPEILRFLYNQTIKIR